MGGLTLYIYIYICIPLINSHVILPGQIVVDPTVNLHFWLVVLIILKTIKVNGKDCPIYYGKKNMFETTNQYIYIHIINTYIKQIN